MAGVRIIHGGQMGLARPQVEVFRDVSMGFITSHARNHMESYGCRAHFTRMTSTTATADAVPPAHHGPRDRLPVLMLGAVGVVYGDIGTSPLYAMKESSSDRTRWRSIRCTSSGHLAHFWSLMLIVTIKYVAVAMRADNRGEGGSLALLALISRNLQGRKWTASLVTMGVLATCLFFGDAMITPAISVLSAVEGLTIVQANLQPLVIPISIAILFGLFLVQARGTALVGAMFGPIVLVYFAELATLGVRNISAHSEILGALSPSWAIKFFLYNPKLAFLAMGSVFWP